MFSRRTLVALGLAATASAGPCDIYSEGGVPCIAAHSTTRALYSAFSGALYQIQRGSDDTTTTISPLTAGGVADAAAQDTFCANTTCLITIIYDQSGHGNHLTQAPPGGFDGPDVDGYDNLASAIGAPVTLNGQKAYGVFVSPGTGYRIDDGNGTATGDEPEGMYAVLDGTHYNGECCFDYGNAETSNTDTGAGHMEAIYYGNSTSWGYGAGDGPWIMVDMENNLFSGADEGYNAADPSLSYRFVTAAVKGGPDEWAIRGANAASGSLSTYYSGVRPDYSGYNPMSKEGSIILGIGGDNSNGAQGTFYEGVMTTGYPSDDTENSVQANIVDAGYAITSLVSGPTLTAGESISLRVTTPGYTTRYIAHTGTTVNTQVISSSSSTADQELASWKVVTGLANSGCFSFESVDTPGSYIRHYDFDLLLNADDGTKQFYEDATFCPQAALNGEGTSLRSWSYPTRYFRHYDDVLYAASNGGVQTFDSKTSFNDDVSFEIYTAFA
ncbi:alpha-L-arabinofuranosidase B [Aspergillus heteromorphus CBS 117.55]|uniref:Alpha-L-arabinofuranosidase n=1 Tax=Aspergillus heteromorphus CBS 117.55 TaxID=1448321 RepID=A0A317WNW6_9EURO|nr:alpha-L-arabinofuranosidase B [Aspergillus heteromorphus CBS 117.55]PWY88174.1 alpha-L-arabinofuranosidase B [Aspergillus heteromorphus CBS 117.55]